MRLQSQRSSLGFKLKYHQTLDARVWSWLYDPVMSPIKTFNPNDLISLFSISNISYPIIISFNFHSHSAETELISTYWKHLVYLFIFLIMYWIGPFVDFLFLKSCSSVILSPCLCLRSLTVIALCLTFFAIGGCFSFKSFWFLILIKLSESARLRD